MKMNTEDANIAKKDLQRSGQLKCARLNILDQSDFTINIHILGFKRMFYQHFYGVTEKPTWSNEAASRFIENKLLGDKTTDLLIVRKTKENKYTIIRGAQKFLAFERFFHGNLTLQGLQVLNHFNGCTFNDLSDYHRNLLELRVVAYECNDDDIIKAFSDNTN